MSTYVRVKPEKTIRLVPHIPFVIAWLRHKDPRAAELFNGPAKHVDDDEVQTVYRNLLDALDTYGDLSTAQLRSICMDYEPPVWARAIHSLFMGSEPRIVPMKVAEGLFNAFKKVRDPSNGSEVATKLSGELDKLRLISLEALGELCALIRDTSTDMRTTAQKIGPYIFLNDENVQVDFVVASKLMQSMVEHADIVFGKPATRSNYDPLGVRRSDYLEEQQFNFENESQFSGRSMNRRVKPQQEKKEMATALADAGFM